MAYYKFRFKFAITGEISDKYIFKSNKVRDRHRWFPTYYNNLEFVKKNHLNGVDRIVPIGQAMNIDVIWDGYETLKHLSRVITVD